MSGIATAIVGGAVVSGIASNSAAKKAAKAQGKASDAGIAEQRYEFDKVQELLKPYSDAGTEAVGAQSDLLGLNGPEKQQAALDAIRNSPEFASMLQQGEEGILQNASATGGVRGGNTQGVLSQFRPQLLSQLIESRFTKLGGVAGLGQASAAGTAAAAQNTGNNITDLLTQAGQARAGAALAGGQAIGNVGNSIAQAAILKQMKVF
ncbi:MAG: hypothetical protein RLZZ200_1116 [Pseudomonadota bacterium]|jgi:hypothetical protein